MRGDTLTSEATYGLSKLILPMNLLKSYVRPPVAVPSLADAIPKDSLRRPRLSLLSGCGKATGKVYPYTAMAPSMR